MSLTSTISLLGPTPQGAMNYVTKSVANDGTTRIASDSTLASPQLLTIKHAVNGKGADATDRHLVSFSKSLMDGSKPVTVTCNFTLSVPRSTEVTNAMINQLVLHLAGFVTGNPACREDFDATNLIALLRGES